MKTIPAMGLALFCATLLVAGWWLLDFTLGGYFGWQSAHYFEDFFVAFGSAFIAASYPRNDVSISKESCAAAHRSAA